MKRQKNITLDEQTLEQLAALEEETTLTASALIRQYIREAYRAMIQRRAQERALERNGS